MGIVTSGVMLACVGAAAVDDSTAELTRTTRDAARSNGGNKTKPHACMCTRSRDHCGPAEYACTMPRGQVPCPHCTALCITLRTFPCRARRRAPCLRCIALCITILTYRNCPRRDRDGWACLGACRSLHGDCGEQWDRPARGCREQAVLLPTLHTSVSGRGRSTGPV